MNCKSNDYEVKDVEYIRKIKTRRLTSGCTDLMYACQLGYIDDIVKELRTKPKTVYIRDKTNKSALHYCSGQRDLAAAASVTVAAPDLLMSTDEDGFTPLHLAVIQGNMPLVNLLLANKSDVNALDNEGHSVVHWATVCGEVEALRSVLAAGADVSIPDINGGSSLHYAAQMCGATYEGKTTDGQNSSKKLALEILNIFLHHPKTLVDVTDKDGRQPILWAASAGSASAVLALVKAGARVESSDKDGLTAIHCAASRGHTDCIDSLISLCGAPTDLIDSNGCTALHYAVTLGHADATSLLLKLEADPNRQDRKGRTPAHCGCAKGQFETVKILKDHGANMWLRNAKGDLPVHEAASSGRRELVEWLLAQRPNQINTTSNDGRTLLHIAAANDNTDMAKMLLDLGADINSIYRTISNIVLTPLDCALQKGHRSIAKFLQLHGGLPASKLRLSGRKPNALNDQELVTPLTFNETTPAVENPVVDARKSPAKRLDIEDNLIKSKKILVCVKDSDTCEECGYDEKIPIYYCEHNQRSRLNCKHNHCNYHQHKKHRRRTSSCETYYHHHKHRHHNRKHKDVSSSDICRSKSNIEIRRRCTSRNRSRHVSSSDNSTGSTASYDDDDDDDNDEVVCCSHKKTRKEKQKAQKKRDRSVVSQKKSRFQEHSDSTDDHLIVDKRRSRNHHYQKSENKTKTDNKNVESKANEIDKNKNSENVCQDDTKMVTTTEIKTEPIDNKMEATDVKSTEVIIESKEIKLIETTTRKTSATSRPASAKLKKKLSSGRIKSGDVKQKNDKSLIVADELKQTVEPCAPVEEKIDSTSTVEIPSNENVQKIITTAEVHVPADKVAEDTAIKDDIIPENTAIKDDVISEDTAIKNDEIKQDKSIVTDEQIKNECDVTSVSKTTIENDLTPENVEQQHKDLSNKDDIDLNRDKDLDEVLTDSTYVIDKIEDNVTKVSTTDVELINNVENELQLKIEDSVDVTRLDDSVTKTDSADTVIELSTPIIENSNIELQSNELETNVTPEIESENVKQVQNTADLVTSEQPVDDTTAQENVEDNQVSALTIDKRSPSFTILPDTSSFDNDGVQEPNDDETKSTVENKNATQQRKSSFTVLKSDESIEKFDGIYDEDESTNQMECDNKSISQSFQVLSDTVNLSTATADDKTDQQQFYYSSIEEDENFIDRSIRDGSQSALDYTNGRRKRFKKRVKSVRQYSPNEKKLINRKSSASSVTVASATIQQQSKDQDSGFEPSPRAMSTKIPSPRGLYSAVHIRPTDVEILDGRSCSSRLEGRKPGDKKTCNMTTVNDSIQQNVKRYYMERKIFQHLLELKSLQIRSSKVNEAVLVKRAVEDYHKSTIAMGLETGASLRRYQYKEYTFKNFEMFLYETLKSLQKSGTHNFQNISDVYKEAERRLSPDYTRCEKALHCTTKTHRCLHAAHAYTGIPCAAYIPMMNHHTMPKYGFGPLKTTGVGSFYLPKILTRNSKCNKVSLELSHGNNKQLITLPSDKLDSNKRYYVTFTVKGNNQNGGPDEGVVNDDECMDADEDDDVNGNDKKLVQDVVDGTTSSEPQQSSLLLTSSEQLGSSQVTQ